MAKEVKALGKLRDGQFIAGTVEDISGNVVTFADKDGAESTCILPDHVIEKLNAFGWDVYKVTRTGSAHSIVTYDDFEEYEKESEPKG